MTIPTTTTTPATERARATATARDTTAAPGTAILRERAAPGPDTATATAPDTATRPATAAARDTAPSARTQAPAVPPPARTRIPTPLLPLRRPLPPQPHRLGSASVIASATSSSASAPSRRSRRVRTTLRSPWNLPRAPKSCSLRSPSSSRWIRDIFRKSSIMPFQIGRIVL